MAFILLKTEYDAEFRNLEKSREAVQRDAFLRTNYINDASIKGIGPARKTVLQSYGIETALDLEAMKISDVPGFGPCDVRLLSRYLHAEVVAVEEPVGAGRR